VTNRITACFAGRLPPFAIVHHVGRTSGKEYATPVLVFRRGSDFIIALTYGLKTEWCKNVLAADGCTLEYRGRRYEVDKPVLAELDDVQDSVPAVVRFILNRIRAHNVLILSTEN
jgi:deazaflavin-dependent oxidoreductase (nitroreductase family)